MTFYDFLLIVLKFYTNYLHFDKSSLTFFFNTLLANFIIRNNPILNYRPFFTYICICNIALRLLRCRVCFKEKGRGRCLWALENPSDKRKIPQKPKKSLENFANSK